jgi:broad specificity phosphatase PhoE
MATVEVPLGPHGMLVTFVRHSESANNTLTLETKADRHTFELTRHTDAPLTDRGVQQAELVGARVAAENGLDASLIITSYFHRALRTAAALEAAIRVRHPESTVEVMVDRDFHEVGGHYKAQPALGEGGGESHSSGYKSHKLAFVGSPGRTIDDVTREFPTFRPVSGQKCEEGWWREAGKEDLEAARRRSMSLWARLAEIAREGKHKSVIVVTHGHLYALMMHEANQRRMFVNWTPDGPESRLQNTGVTRVVVHPTTQTDDGASAPATLTMLLENCGKHVAGIGSLAAANLPL